jgi:protoheme IX farnesyltransferase
MRDDYVIRDSAQPATTARERAGDEERTQRFRVADYATLAKPRVMSLVVFTAVVGMLLSPGAIDPLTAVIAVTCIAVGAAASGAINMWYDRDIDHVMRRTQNRPIPSGRMQAGRALAFGIALAVSSVTTMALMVNAVAAALLAVTILYYVLLYTMWLKRRTAQNIVIGGAAGAFPPMIGWAAASGEIGLGAGVLFAIIFLWTPPHSWALALYRREDYARAGVPMMPMVAGARGTKLRILIYSVLLLAATSLPVFIGMAGALYGTAAGVLGAGFLYKAILVWRDPSETALKTARPLFFYSIMYLFLIFVFLLAERLIPAIFA